MTLNDENSQSLINYRLQQAEESKKATVLLIENKQYKAALNRIYYSIFYVVSALAIKHKFKTSKHVQLIGWFNKNFIFNGIIDKRYNQILRDAFTARSEADYGEFVEFTEDQVIEMYEEMKDFINVVKSLILSKEQ